MFVSKYDAEAYSDVKVMSETARAACIRATIAEIWKIFSEWGYHCSTNEDVFQSISYIFLYTRDTETVCLPFLVVHDQLHAHLSKDKGEETNGEETNWCKRALGLAKANEVLAELKHQKTKLLRAVFVFISPSPTRYWQTVRHAFVCLHTFSTKSTPATTHVMSAVGDASKQWPKHCWPNHAPGRKKEAIWRPLCKAVHTSIRGDAVDLQRMLRNSICSEHICLPYTFLVMAKLSTTNCLKEFFCTTQLQWELHALVQKPLVESIQRLSQNFFMARSLDHTWRCAYFPVDWVEARDVDMPLFGECTLHAGLCARVVYDVKPGAKKPKTSKLVPLCRGLYILGRVVDGNDDRVERIRAAFTRKPASKDESEADVAHQALEKGIECLGALADSCDGSESSMLTTIGQKELFRVLQAEGHVAKTITRAGELIVQLEGQNDSNAAVVIKLDIDSAKLPCYVAMAARLKPSQQHMSLQVNVPTANGRSSCVWSCLQWQTGGKFFTFAVLKEWSRFYSWREWFQGARGNDPDRAGSRSWIPNEAQEVKNNVLTYFMRQVCKLRNERVQVGTQKKIVKHLRSPSSVALCGRYMVVGFPKASSGKPNQKWNKCLNLDDLERARLMMFATVSDSTDDEEMLDITRERLLAKRNLRRYLAIQRAKQEKAEESNETADSESDEGQVDTTSDHATNNPTKRAAHGTSDSQTDEGQVDFISNKASYSLTKRAAHRAGITLTDKMRKRIGDGKTMERSSTQHAIAVNFDDPLGPTLYDPSSRTVHRGFADVVFALTNLYDVELEHLKWTQLYVESPGNGMVPWCGCPAHRADAESLSAIVTPKVQTCMRAP